MTHTYTPKSTNIKSSSYDSKTGQMSIVFLDKPDITYTHLNVPQEIWDNYTRYRSAGQYYHHMISKRFKKVVS